MSSASAVPTYPEITKHAQYLADEQEAAPSLPEVPPLPVPATRDREGWLVRVCVGLICLFFVVLFISAVTCRR